MTVSGDNLAATVRRVLTEQFPDSEQRQYCVSFSGGLDSTVLLSLMSSLVGEWPKMTLRAIHVNHGLYADADRWQAAAQSFANKLKVGCSAIRLEKPPRGPAGIEAEARRARYQALSDNLESGEILVCAHHLDDQLETFVLQLMRGSGPAGLAAMPVLRELGQGYLLRPLLSVSRGQLSAWAEQEGLTWCEDSSNQNEQFSRNYLRLRVLPLLRERWPAAARSASRSAALCAEADQLLEQLAQQDLGDLPDADYRGSVLPLKCLEHLDPARVRNALRRWIRRQGFVVPGHAPLLEIVDCMIPAKADAEPRVTWDGAELRRYRDELYLMRPQDDPPSAVLQWDAMDALQLPGGLGQLQILDAPDPRSPGGISASLLERPRCVRFRAGGEKFHPAGGKNKSLKKYLQERGVPPWLRSRVPLVFIEDRLAWVPGIGCTERVSAGAGEKAKIIVWNRVS